MTWTLRLAICLLLAFAGASQARDLPPLCFLVGPHWVLAVGPDGSGQLSAQGRAGFRRSLPAGTFDYQKLVKEVRRLGKQGPPRGDVVRYFFGNLDRSAVAEVSFSPRLQAFFSQADAALRALGDRRLDALLRRRPLVPASP